MYSQHITLIQAAFSGGAGISGCELAPSALRQAGLGNALRLTGHWVREAELDLTDCAPSGRAALPQLVTACQRVRTAVDAALAVGELPILVGGDHSLSIGSLAAVARHCAQRRRPLWVLWFDAHADFNTIVTSPSGNVHGMPVAAVCGLGDAALLAVGDRVPMVDPDHLYLLGVRAIDTVERELLQGSPVNVYTAQDARDHGLATLVEGVLRQVAASGGHLHVSLDIDVMDPLVAPGVGSPEAHGIEPQQMQQALQCIAQSGLLASLDVMELNPLQDFCGVTARLTVGLVETVVGRAATIRSAGSF